MSRPDIHANYDKLTELQRLAVDAAFLELTRVLRAHGVGFHGGDPIERCVDAMAAAILAAPPSSKRRPAKIVYVFIHRAEGPVKDFTMRPVTYEGDTAEEQGNDWLRKIARTAPRDGSYDKTDVVIRLADGQELSGRFDIQHWTTGRNDTNLRDHFRDTLMFNCMPERFAHIAADPRKLAAARASVSHTVRRESRRILALLSPQDAY